MLAVALALAASSAWACAVEVYRTHVVGWDAQTRTFVIERQRGLWCAGCSCTLSARAFRQLGATGAHAETLVSLSDSCGDSFSLFPPGDEGTTAAGKKAAKAWVAARPGVERAVVSSLEQGLSTPDLGDARVEVKVGKVALERSRFASFLSRAGDEEEVLTSTATGPRTITVFRRAKPVAIIAWTPTCTPEPADEDTGNQDTGCHDVRVRWANDGSAVAIVAGPELASFDPAPDHAPKQQPARVYVVDLATGKVSQDRLELPWPADSR